MSGAGGQPSRPRSVQDARGGVGAALTASEVGALRAAAKRARTPLAAHAHAQSGSKDVNKVDALFNAYKSKDETEDVIGPEGARSCARVRACARRAHTRHPPRPGVEKFCGDLGLQPTDRRVLLLAWKVRGWGGGGSWPARWPPRAHALTPLCCRPGARARFSREVRPDLSNYEDNPAWPVLLDNFVDWYQGQQAGGAD